MPPPARQIEDVKERLAAGWTFEVYGNSLVGTSPGDPPSKVSKGCGTEEAARELLEAATA